DWSKDESGRWLMKELPGTEQFFQADLIFLAMGFLGPEEKLLNSLGLKIDQRKNIETPKGRYSTAVPGVFAAGDCRRGQSLIVWGINEGRQAAREVDQYLMGNTILPVSGGIKQQAVHERSDWPKEKFQKLFENDTIAVIGYGPQGRGQSLNAKDNGLNVIVGLREGGRSWKLALEDGTIIGNLLSDAAQKELWPQFVPHLTKGKTLYFSHGFSIVYKDETKVIPPKDIDVIMIAPKGTVRSQFLDGRGINSSFAVFQDVSGKARDRCVALGIAIGSGYLYETDFKKEVFSDLFGERGVLMGAIQGLFLAQYEVLRERGHTPSEAFNETVEEATQSLYPLIGALDWYKPFHDATKPVFERLYASVADGTETRRTLEKNSSPTYREELEEELKEI
ncbi:17665_t:CDS:2, partial [Racocetra fulgida]